MAPVWLAEPLLLFAQASISLSLRLLFRTRRRRPARAAQLERTGLLWLGGTVGVSVGLFGHILLIVNGC